ncbi:MAG: hypothetical protein QXK45_05660 [Thermofilaceae archaeon]
MDKIKAMRREYGVKDARDVLIYYLDEIAYLNPKILIDMIIDALINVEKIDEKYFKREGIGFDFVEEILYPIIVKALEDDFLMKLKATISEEDIVLMWDQYCYSDDPLDCLDKGAKKVANAVIYSIIIDTLRSIKVVNMFRDYMKERGVE